MEALVQYLWQHRLWPPGQLRLTDGRPVTVIDPGQLNTGSGPDFFNAKIRLGDRIWAGDVEIHLRASDWNRHGHAADPAYDSVILHVVTRDDCPIRRRTTGEIIPQLVVTCSPEFKRRCDDLLSRAPMEMPCADEIARSTPLHIADWMASLALERLYMKADRITSLLSQTAGDWRRACFVTLARGLGFGTNSEPLQRLALSVGLPVLDHHSDSLTALEAILFGQSGLLTDASAPDDDPYVALLRSEYAFLATKYGLTPVSSPGWKRGRLRPANMPHRRVAMLALMTLGGFDLQGRIADCRSADDARALFGRSLSGYWATHYGFGVTAGDTTPPLTLSARSADILVINVVVPMLLAHGLAVGDLDAPERAVSLLESLPPERNTVIDAMARAGLPARDALTTQALIGLRRNYCEARKCLYCRMGHRLFQRATR